MNARHSASALILALAGCAPQAESVAPMATAAASATETLRNATGRPVATAAVTQLGDSLRVRIDSTALPAGKHGAHVHAVGVCAAPSFESAGPHWNPTGRQHGKNNPAGMHKGDLPNLLVDASGRGTLEYVIPGAAMMGAGSLIDADGAAIVVHARADDDRTDPSGDSGGRIACAAFR